ncbi:MAG: hypothetical protein HYT43_00705 [Candidatus Taylorbacteria bacterium]|nr:hypothetical protein [Candidatus Taylorbacteria bacterium]
MILSVIFSVSLLGLVVLLALKARELRGGGSFLASLSLAADPVAERFVTRFFSSLGKLAKIFPRLAGLSAIFLARLSLGLIFYLQKLLAGFSSFIRGQMRLRRRGATSFFLKEIFDHKRRISEE